MNSPEVLVQQTSVEISMPVEVHSLMLDLSINSIEITALLLIALASLMCLYRLIVGPTNPDRIVSADTLSVIATVMLCCVAALFGSVLYLDVAVIYGVLSFVGIIALARAIEGGHS